MSYTDLRDFSPEYVETFDDFRVEIEKLGGGTIGKRYTSELWRYRVVDLTTEMVMMRGQDLYIGLPASHQMAAAVAHEYALYLEDGLEG